MGVTVSRLIRGDRTLSISEIVVAPRPLSRGPGREAVFEIGQQPFLVLGHDDCRRGVPALDRNTAFENTGSPHALLHEGRDVDELEGLFGLEIDCIVGSPVPRCERLVKKEALSHCIRSRERRITRLGGSEA